MEGPIMSRQRLVIDKTEIVEVTREGDPPEVKWGDRDCTDRTVYWKNIRFSHHKNLRNWDTEVLWERDKEKTIPGYQPYCYDIDKYDTPQHSYSIMIDVPWDYAGQALYIVVARHSDGDTFGYDEGYEDVVGVFADEGRAIYFRQKYYDMFKRRYDTYFGRLQELRIEGLLKMPDEI